MLSRQLAVTASVLFACLPAALAVAADNATPDASPLYGSRPNIVFILADDLGYGDLSCYGQTQFTTPNIDRLAAEGTRFTQFYAGSTVCAPSRCVLMTGLHTGHCYIRGNAKMNLRPGDVTVAGMLKQAGYRTGLFGKWGLGHEGSTGVPTQQGFDEFFGYLDQSHAHNYYPAFLHRGEERVNLKNVVPGGGKFGSGVASEKVEYSADLILDEALSFLDRQKEETPFFLYFATTLPHANNEAKNKGMEIPDLGEFADKDWPEPQKGLAAMITKLDGDVGKLMDKLAAKGFDQNTVVLFSSDNGPHSEGGNDSEYFNSNGPLRGQKRAPYDGGIRVPMIVRWPGKVSGGATSDHVGFFGDFFATAADFSGAEAPENLDSISFLPTLIGDKQQQHDCLYWEFYERGSFQALRMGDWKAVVKPIGGDKVELYNMTTDIDESENVADAHPDVAAKALKLIRREHIPSPDWMVRPRRN